MSSLSSAAALSLISVAYRPGSCRLYVAGLRCHHGLSGLAIALIGVLTRNRALFLVGCLAVAHDWKDYPWPLIDP